MATILDLKATSESSFNIGISSTAIKLKNVSGVLHLRDKADSGFIDLEAGNITGSILTVDDVNVTSNSIVLNSDGAGIAPSDFKLTLSRPASGMVADVTYTFPAAPTNGYFLTTDASGNMSWQVISSPSVTDRIKLVEQPFTFNEAFGPSVIGVDFQYTVAGQRIVKVEVIVIDAFNGSVNNIKIAKLDGIGGEEVLMSVAQSDLTDANTKFVSEPLQSNVLSEQVAAYITATSATNGTGFIRIYVADPVSTF